ncbi:Flp pilus assembly protein TadG [Variovorax sp. TBS-050B]|uniref:TadE/TadG family type IV pilus assembly protein n=1 Tax=Variovorax sp. TBS-050B TaxID=2940551 RepID=UPI0024754FE4|nr:TadE/TadG family type IV pilus assembly protein [Variovorax sp. TBS-050B]MDH6591325.1 Flp pilus assembly protein TadG [Variovorax sp. TBS-050B]
MRQPARLSRAMRRQRGIAAIEFALVFMTLFFIIYALATFGAVLYTQQVVARAAEDGARAIPRLLSPPVAANDARVRAAVYDSLSASLVVPAASSGSWSSKRSWIAANTTVAVTLGAPAGGGAGTTAVVTLSYPYSANRLLPTLPVLDTSRWMPDTLRSQAAVATSS